MSDPLDLLYPELDEQERKLKRKQAYAQALMQSGFEGGGASPGAGLRSAGSAILGAVMSNRADKQATAFAKQRAAMLGQMLGGGGSPQLSNAPQSIPGQPDLDTQSVGAPAPQVSKAPAMGGAGPDMHRLALAIALSGGDPKGLIEAQNYRTPEQQQALRTQGAIETAQGSREPIDQAGQRAGAIATAQEGAKGTFHPATPDDIAQRGLPQGTTGQINSVTGEFKRDFTPPQPSVGMTPEAAAQAEKIRRAGQVLTPEAEQQKIRMAEAEARARAEATMDPEAIHTMAQLYANYDAPFPSGGFALSKPAIQAAIKEAAQINPSFDATNYATKQASKRSFASGQDGRNVQSVGVALQHLDVLQKAMDALKNGDIPAANAARNWWLENTGSPLPTTPDAIKNIVGAEITKAVTPSGGGVTDREENRKSLKNAASPEQVRGAIEGYKGLMVGQLRGLQKKYEFNTKANDFEKMLLPEAAALLRGVGAQGQGTPGKTGNPLVDKYLQ